MDEDWKILLQFPRPVLFVLVNCAKSLHHLFNEKNNFYKRLLSLNSFEFFIFFYVSTSFTEIFYSVFLQRSKRISHFEFFV